MNRSIQFWLFTICFVVVGQTSVLAQVRINEVGLSGAPFEGAQKWVELFNAGTDEVDVSTMQLCDFPQYQEFRFLTTLAGNTTIPPGGYLVVAWPALDMNNSGDSELGLYVAGTFDYNDPTKILDYIQWGSGNHTRAAAAETAGVWTASEFAMAPSDGQSLQFVDNGSPGVGNWVTGNPSPNSENVIATRVEEDVVTPKEFVLIGNFPNPFNPSTTIVYEVNRPGLVALSVYDVLGQKVVDLHNGRQGVGKYEVSWDGKDTRGVSMVSGVYLYRLSFDGAPGASRVMTLLK